MCVCVCVCGRGRGGGGAAAAGGATCVHAACAALVLCATPGLPAPLAAQAPPTDLFRPVALGGGLYVAGDHRTTATLDGALKSGRLAAEAVLADLRK